MLVIPSIDISEGMAVKRVQGVKGTEVVKTDPMSVLEYILKFRNRLERLHVVDLDGARAGRPVNLEIVKKIVENCQGLRVQVGGGIRKLEHALELARLDVDVVIGSVVFKDFQEAQRIVKTLGSDKVFVAVDVKGGKLAIQGWEEVAVVNVVEYLRRLDVVNIIHTCVDVEGTLQGPRPYMDLINSLRRNLGIKYLFYAGGVRDKSDVEYLEKLGFNGVIIGMAMYMRGLEHFLQ